MFGGSWQLSTPNLNLFNTTFSNTNEGVLQSSTQSMMAPLPVPSHLSATDVSQLNITTEIDRIMAKIDQDNKILAELDNTRFTIGRSSMGNTTTCSRQLPIQPKLNTSSMTGSSLVSSNAVTQSWQDHLTRHTLPTLPSTMGVDQTNYVVSTSDLPLMSHMQPSALPINIPQSSLSNPRVAQYQPQYVLNNVAKPSQLLPQQPIPVSRSHSQPRLMPQIPTTQFDLEGLYPTHNEHHDPKVVDMLDIPGKGRCYVYIAKYSYDPFQQSPNECPEAELAINAGDYFLVWGNMDEDGFFDGELLDGRRGLVPSNFVQKLVGDDLLEFHHSVVQCLRDSDDAASTNIPQDFDYHQLNSGDFSKRITGEFDLSDILEEEEEEEEMDNCGEGPVAAPKQLTLERQLNKSVLIGWNHPDSPTSPPIDCYHVYVDGVLKVTVKSTERPRALVEGVDSNRPHRISVRSVTANRRTSRDAACTMVIGKDVPLGPTNVKALRVTASSAVISWMPSNSNYQHTVCVNNVELRTVKPGVYRHTITGLAPNTVYRVTVRAKNIRAPHFDEKTNIPMERYSCHIDFRTLPKGLPEPPGDIQVEAGPQDGTLLVTWQPVTPASSNNGTLVTGYAVYADGKKVTDVDSPTGDHALIDINKLLSLNPKQVTIRTKSRDSQSPDSVPTQIPMQILKGKHSSTKMEEDRRMRYGSSIPAHLRHQQRSGQMVIETEENLSDKEIYPNNNMSIPAIEITKDTGSEINLSEEDYLDRRGGRHYEARGVQRARPHPGHHGRHHRRDEREQFHMVDSRGDMRGRHDREKERERGTGGYRGSRGALPAAQQQSLRDKRTRWFVALFDYDPQTMSPNPDACEEELPFQEGDSIKVYGDKDADGFYWGECKGRRGFVPHNMVVEVQSNESAVGGSSRDRARDRDRWGDIYANMPVKKMIALYDYDPQELSPNVDAEQVELSFNTGDIIYVYGDMDDDGFYMGELDNVRGLVPSNFLTEAPLEYSSGGVGGSSGRGRPAQRMPQQERDRAVGPGARGPPPPPRVDQRTDRRKDACPVPTQVEHRQDGRVEREGSVRGRGGTARKYQVPPTPITMPAPQPDVKPPTTQPESPAPNLMQKLTEMTAGDNSVDHILSKGKELIFMKFGLGK